jgi:hypothetical protein
VGRRGQGGVRHGRFRRELAAEDQDEEEVGEGGVSGLIRSTHDFNTVLRLRPGQYRLKFIVDDSWRCSKLISTATDDDGTLVNWIEVEAPKTEEELKAEWAMDAKPAAKSEDSEWVLGFNADFS